MPVERTQKNPVNGDRRMKFVLNKIRLIIDGELHIYDIKQTVYGHDDGTDTDLFRISFNLGNATYVISNNCMEFAIISLQKQLPDNIQIVCCQTCKHGNFCPFGDEENEIFCLIGYSPKNKSDVVDIFTANMHIEDGFADFHFPRKELLDYCKKYEKINDNYYTYNDWNYHFKKNNE